MQAILQFLTTYEAWIYGLIGLVGLIYLRRLLLAWNEWRTAVFGLERESAQRRLSSSLTVVVLLVLFAVVEFAMVSFVAPQAPAENMLPTPTLDVLATAIPTLSVEEPTPQNLVGVQPTLPAAVQSSCIAGQIEWLSPQADEEISGAVDLVGLVGVTNLGFFKYEYASAGVDNWSTIAAGNSTVLEQEDPEKLNQFQGVWNTDQLVPGDYQLRLVVTDNENQLLPICVIPVRVIAPETP